jgi:predicted nucleic acid-binding protein
MPVVSNTSPILNLAILDQLELLRRQFSKILIPNAVLEELKVNEERPGSQAIREAISSGWIQVQPEFDVRKSARNQWSKELETFCQRNSILNKN